MITTSKLKDYISLSVSCSWAVIAACLSRDEISDPCFISLEWEPLATERSQFRYLDTASLRTKPYNSPNKRPVTCNFYNVLLSLGTNNVIRTRTVTTASTTTIKHHHNKCVIVPFDLGIPREQDYIWKKYNAVENDVFFFSFWRGSGTKDTVSIQKTRCCCCCYDWSRRFYACCWLFCFAVLKRRQVVCVFFPPVGGGYVVGRRWKIGPKWPAPLDTLDGRVNSEARLQAGLCKLEM